MRDTRSKLFGTGIVVYGFTYLLVRHPLDFLSLLSHIGRDYLFEEFKPAKLVKYVDTDLEKQIMPQIGSVLSYMSFMPFLVGCIGFVRWKFGNKTREDICLMMNDVKGLFSDAGFVFDNAPTKIQYRQSPGIGLKILHFVDRPRNCFPSLHVILASYSYLKTKELIDKYSSSYGAHIREHNFLFNWSRTIIESCLLTKQHSLRDIAGGFAAISAKCPQFEQKDIKEMISFLFLDRKVEFPETMIHTARHVISSIYEGLITTIHDQQKDSRSVLVDYVRSI